MESLPSVMIVPCPGDPKIDSSGSGNVSLQDCDVHGYLGSATRLDAAAEISRRMTAEQVMILVGGTEERVRAMKLYIQKRNGLSDDDCCLLTLVSSPGTYGNLRAVKRLLLDETFRQVRSRPERIGILTNFYHHHRAMIMAADILNLPGLQLIPMIAEVFAPSSSQDLEKFAPDFVKRVQSEIRGISDWMARVYQNQFNDDIVT